MTCRFLLFLFSVRLLAENPPPTPTQVPKPVGKVVTLQGKVTMAGKPLTVGAEVRALDNLKTEADSMAKLLMIDRSLLDIGPDTSLIVRQYTDSDTERDVDVSLDFGNVRALVAKKLEKKNRYEIKTKTSVLAVRGTELFVDWREKGGKVVEKITVSQGQVFLSRPASAGTGPAMVTPQMISTGQQYSREGGSNGEVKQLSNAQVTHVVASNTVSDNTFSEATSYKSGSSEISVNRTLASTLPPITPQEVPSAVGFRPGQTPFPGNAVQAPTPVTGNNPISVTILFVP